MDSADQLTLRDRSGHVVDSTPRLSDTAHDDRLWHRGGDGSWELGRGFEFPQRITDGRLAVAPSNC
jgi:hypothetical protein